MVATITIITMITVAVITDPHPSISILRMGAQIATIGHAGTTMITGERGLSGAFGFVTDRNSRRDPAVNDRPVLVVAYRIWSLKLIAYGR